METPQAMRTRVIEKAAEDTEFRARLVEDPKSAVVEDPKSAVERELDISIPAGMAVQVHEESADTVHLILPPNSKLSQADMQAIHAGHHLTDRYGNPISQEQWDRENRLNW